MPFWAAVPISKGMTQDWEASLVFELLGFPCWITASGGECGSWDRGRPDWAGLQCPLACMLAGLAGSQDGLSNHVHAYA